MNGKSTTTLDIFISHSSVDLKVAAALIDLLRDAFSIPAARIRCTSVPGYKLAAGASVNDRLQREIHDARYFIGIITEASLDSTYVLFELGARWGIRKHLIPALAAGADAGILQEPLKSLNSVRCDLPADVHQLLADIESALGLPLGNAAAYQKRVTTLVNQAKKKKRKKKAWTP